MRVRFHPRRRKGKQRDKVRLSIKEYLVFMIIVKYRNMANNCNQTTYELVLNLDL